MRLPKYSELIQTQAPPPPATVRLPILPLHIQRGASQDRRKCRFSLHRTQPSHVRIHTFVGSLPFLDRRADAGY